MGSYIFLVPKFIMKNALQHALNFNRPQKRGDNGDSIYCSSDQIVISVVSLDRTIQILSCRNAIINVVAIDSQ